MSARISMALVLIGLFACATGCKKQVDQTEFKSAINASFTGRHECVWPAPIKLPAQVDPTKDEEVRAYDALADAGLLIRSAVARPHVRGASNQLNQYDLSDKGRPAWTPDPKRPGYGNFCFGHFNVTAISHATPNDPSNPTQYTVRYSYEVEGLPTWVHTPESMRTFPKFAADTSIQSASATLVKDANGGWAVAPPQPAQ
jgi:hypothetical protein